MKNLLLRVKKIPISDRLSFDISISGLTHEDLHTLAVEAFQLQVHRQQDLFIGIC